MRSTVAFGAATSLLASQLVGAFDLNIHDQQSIKDGAKLLATNLMSYYTGDVNNALPSSGPDGTYYWWETGGWLSNMIDYAGRTGDTQYNANVSKIILSQVSPTNDFMMMNLASELGNDDQAFWGLTAMSAVEENLPVPDGADPGIWLTAATGAFNDLIGRWNTTFCGGGIKWHFIAANNGFKYKSSIANAATMQLGARLALHTKNQTFADKATQIWDWMSAVGYIGDKFQIFDGAGDDPDNCTKIDFHEWSYNSGAMLGATAALANYSATNGKPDAQKWADRATGLWKHATDNFFENGVLYEQACEDVDTCDTDQKSFKSYLAKWAVMAGKLVPSLMCDVQAKLQSTAPAVAQSCTGNQKNGQPFAENSCGTKWQKNTYSGDTGVGEQMSAMEVVLGLLSSDFCNAGGDNKAASPSGAPSSAPASSGASTTPAASAIPTADVNAAASAAISAGANPTIVSQAVAAAYGLQSLDPVVASSIIQVAASGASNPAAVSNAIMGQLTQSDAPAPAPTSSAAPVDPTAAAAVISSAVDQAISAGANPTLISAAAAAVNTMSSFDPGMVSSMIQAACSGNANSAAVSSAFAGALTAIGGYGQPAPTSSAPAVDTTCTDEVKTTAVVSTTTAAASTPVDTTRTDETAAASTPATSSTPAAATTPVVGGYGSVSNSSTTVQAASSSTLVPSSGFNYAPTTNGTMTGSSSPPVNTIAQGAASGLKMASWSVLAWPLVLAALA